MTSMPPSSKCLGHRHRMGRIADHDDGHDAGMKRRQGAGCIHGRILMVGRLAWIQSPPNSAEAPCSASPALRRKSAEQIATEAAAAGRRRRGWRARAAQSRRRHLHLERAGVAVEQHEVAVAHARDRPAGQASGLTWMAAGTLPEAPDMRPSVTSATWWPRSCSMPRIGVSLCSSGMPLARGPWPRTTATKSRFSAPA